MKGLRRRLLEGPVTTAACTLGHWLVLALGRTWRVRHVGTERVARARFGKGPIVLALPHGILLPLTYTHRDRGMQVLVSESRDGEIIARILRNLGFGCVRGSSTRGGGRAVVRMGAKGREGYDLAVTPDGPRGPRGSIAPGVALISARGDAPIIPSGAAASPAWNAASWDRFLVPLPFAKVWIVYGTAIDCGGGRHEDAPRRLELALAALEEEARRYAEGEVVPERSVRVPA